MKTDIHFPSHLAQFFLERHKLRTKFVVKIKNILSIELFSDNYAVYEIMWKNVQPGRPQMTIWRTRTLLGSH